MTGDELDRELEAELRAELRASIVPPPTPEHVYDAVNRLALTRGRQERVFGMVVPLFRRPVLASLAAALAVVALVAGAVLLRGAVQPETGPAHSAFPNSPSSASPGAPANPKSGIALVGGWIDGQSPYVFVDDSEFRVSRDGGVTWSEARSLPAGSIRDLQFVDASHAWSAGTRTSGSSADVLVYRSDDAGRTWTGRTIATLDLADGAYPGGTVHFVDPEHGVALSQTTVAAGGRQSYANCAVQSTDDGGATWSGRRAAPCFGFTAPTWVSPLAGYVHDATGATMLTRDGGRTWAPLALPGLGSGDRVNVMLLQQLGPDRLRVVATFVPADPVAYNDMPPAVFDSTDGGATWRKARSLDYPYRLREIAAVGPDHWFANAPATDSPPFFRLVESYDAGLTWDEVRPRSLTLAGTNVRLGPDSGLVGDFGMTSWGDQLHGIVQGVYMDCASGGACGGSGALYVTRDGGLTWTEIAY